MNIFKILASGDGRLYEPNVSAFLAYLLDPNEMHGLGNRFLKSFLDYFLSETNSFSVDTLFSTFEGDKSIDDIYVEVQLEYPLEIKNKENFFPQIVDIIIFFLKKPIGVTTDEFKMNIKSRNKKNRLQNDNVLAAIMVENKINALPTKMQLKAQYDNAIEISHLNLLANNLYENIFLISLTPSGLAYKKNWEMFKDEIRGSWIKWSSKNEESDEFIKNFINHYPEEPYKILLSSERTVLILLKEFLVKEEELKVNKSPEYTKLTILKFIEFIESEFRAVSKSSLQYCSRKDFYNTLLEKSKLNDASVLFLMDQKVRVEYIPQKINHYNGDLVNVKYYKNEGGENFFLRIEIYENIFRFITPLCAVEKFGNIKKVNIIPIKRKNKDAFVTYEVSKKDFLMNDFDILMQETQKYEAISN